MQIKNEMKRELKKKTKTKTKTKTKRKRQKQKQNEKDKKQKLDVCLCGVVNIKPTFQGIKLTQLTNLITQNN